MLPSAASVDMTGAAQVVVQRLLDRWAGPVTFSVGIATHRAGDAPSTTLARADAAVYEAKARGRDTVVLAEDMESVGLHVATGHVAHAASRLIGVAAPDCPESC